MHILYKTREKTQRAFIYLFYSQIGLVKALNKQKLAASDSYYFW